MGALNTKDLDTYRKKNYVAFQNNVGNFKKKKYFIYPELCFS